ncbi:zinc finger protein [Trichonephila inaurata madagascariensis]|uniref:Zinc finger protein n=1 Tax=Trichonephila inaurata madagascariensis TaxID=2747483 RepID=A0A8X6I9S8_9ARAC|nr:zinc finger protein [Trichonephila inaurata madagascariensis]
MAQNSGYHSFNNIPPMKKCNVVLNRNFIDVLGYKKNVKDSTCYIIPSEQSLENEASDSSTSDTSSSSSDTIRAFKKKKRSKINKPQIELKKLFCSVCKKNFDTHSSLLVHISSHKSKKFKCVICNMTFPHRASFIYHMEKNHPEVEPFVCTHQKCDKSFRTQKMLQVHEKSHKKYMCKYCKKTYIRKSDMRLHVKEVHL